MTIGVTDLSPLEEDPTLAPADILAAWRATERAHARTVPGTDEATALHAEMRRLMDDYEWRIRGGVPIPPPRSGAWPAPGPSGDGRRR